MLYSHLYMALWLMTIYPASSFILPAISSGDRFCLSSFMIRAFRAGLSSIFMPWYLEYILFTRALCWAVSASYRPSFLFRFLISLEMVLVFTFRMSDISDRVCPTFSSASILSRPDWFRCLYPITPVYGVALQKGIFIIRNRLPEIFISISNMDQSRLTWMKFLLL